MIRRLDKNCLHDIADLHYKVLHWSVNARLGRDHIRGLYASMIELPSTFGFVYYQQDRLIAFIMGTLDSREIRTGLPSNFNLPKLLRLTINVLKRPQDAVDIVETAYVIPRFLGKYGTKPELSTWVSDTDHPLSPFAAIQCMNAAQKHILDQGYTHCVAQVLKENVAPNKFYARTQSTIIKSLPKNNVYLIKCEQHTRPQKSAK
jgi:hypothetical protein